MYSQATVTLIANEESSALRDQVDWKLKLGKRKGVWATNIGQISETYPAQAAPW